MTNTADRDHDTQRLSFGQAAAAYDRIRPSYPVAGVAWALAGHTGRVVDLGAGTGLMTRVIQQVADVVIPVEPDAGMRAQLDATTSGVTAADGSAESIPAADATVDGVVAGQAYHWFDKEMAHVEIARVLKTGGVFAPIWNIRDERVPWVGAISDAFEGRAMPSHDGYLPERTFGELFSEPQSEQFEHSVTMTADDMVALMQSRSYFLTADAELRQQMERVVREITAPLGESFELPYVTYCYRAYKL
jgi:SAM-dependent methyltransferase